MSRRKSAYRSDPAALALATEASRQILAGGIRREVARNIGVQIGVLDYWAKLGLIPRPAKCAVDNPESRRTAAAVQVMLDAGMTQVQVAKHFEISVSKITRWTQRGLIAKR